VSMCAVYCISVEAVVVAVVVDSVERV